MAHDRKSVAVTVLVLASALGAARAEELRLPLSHGLWATGDGVCAMAPPGPVEDSFIEIGRGTFSMYESFCRIGNVRQSEPAEYRATLTCTSEGMPTSVELHIVKHSPKRFTVLDGPGRGKDYVHCGRR